MVDWHIVWSYGLAVAVGLIIAGLIRYAAGLIAGSKTP